MLKIRYETEDWCQALANEIDLAEDAAGVNLELEAYGDVADDFRRNVCRALDDAGVDYERAYRQSVGTNVIVQAGTAAERDVFDAAIDAAMPEARRLTGKTVALAKSAT